MPSQYPITMKNLSPSSLFLLSFLFIQSISAQGQSIQEELFVSIGGIEQWITIKGKDRSNPVVLFLHGGPGSTASPYAEAIFGDREEDFTLVQWDQRGAGRTFGRNAPENVDEDYWIENPLTVDQMAADGIEVAEYLLEKLGKEKIILTGSSWGSVLGAKMALQRPDLFYAYIGHAQIVNPGEDLKAVYENVLSISNENQDQESVAILEKLGPPPYDNARNTGQLMRVIKKHERENSVPAPEEWRKPAPEYDNETDARNRENGDDYSFIHYAGHAPLGISGMNASVDLSKDGLDFLIPVYLIQGQEDLLTPTEINKAFFDKINAPEKEYVIVPEAAHGFNKAVVDMHFSLLKSRILPLINQ